MYLRLVRVRVKPERVEENERWIQATVVPTLQETPGCLFACGTHSTKDPAERILLSLWDDPAHLAAWAESAACRRLWVEAAQFLADSSEWKIQLSEDYAVEYKPVPEKPVVQALPVSAAMTSTGKAGPPGEPLHLRILSLTIRAGHKDALRQQYEEEIIPALRLVKGCRYALLTDSAESANAILSITIWDSREHAEEYERSGRFEALVRKTRPHFSEFFRWKLALDSGGAGRTATSDDLSVESFTVVSGRSFDPA